MKSIITLIVLLLLISSCKTREQIAREKLIDDLASQVKDGQQVQSDYVTKIQSLEEQVALVNGRSEEATVEDQGKKEKLETQINLLEIQFKESNERIAKMEKQVAAQEVYLKKVLKTLSGISGGNKTVKKKSSSPMTVAIRHYKSARYDQARPIFLSLLKKKINENDKKRILHNLGVLEYLTNNHQDALTYLSRLYTNYPKSNYNKNGLFYLGKTFQALKQIDEAKETYSLLVKTYPKAKQTVKAQKILKTL